MWQLSTRDDEYRRQLAQGEGDVTDLVDLNLNLDGSGQLFCGRATDRRLGSEQPMLIEVVIAGNVEAFFRVMGALYAAADYHGVVDVGVAVTGIEGACSARRNRMCNPGPVYPVGTVARTDRVGASELGDAAAISYRLLRHLFEASSGIDGYNPRTQPENR